MSFSDIPSKRIESHSNTCANTVITLLCQAFTSAHPADKLLASHLKANHQLGSRDRRIISETLYSVLRWWGWLRHLAPAPFLKAIESKQEPLPEKQHADEWNALLCASWLLEGRSELPPSAQWWLHHSGARTAKLEPLPADAPFQERRKLLRPFFEKEGSLPPMPIDDLLPDWCQSLVDSPIDWSELIRWMQTRPPVWLRAQTNDVDRLVAELRNQYIRVTAHPKMRHALKASFSGINLRSLPLFQKGLIEVQDLASQAISQVCAPSPGERWWDACAGAGGKTLHLAFQMQGKGHITASDNRLYKLEELKMRARRCAFSNIITKEWLGIDVPRYHGHFHGVLVDAPCSCSGVWRRSPWLKWTTSRQELEAITHLQTQLLENASHGVAPGGRLVYATCSIFTCENQDIVHAFLEKHPDFALEEFASPLDGTLCKGQLQIWPWDGDCDGMFVARFKRNQD